MREVTETEQALIDTYSRQLQAYLKAHEVNATGSLNIIATFMKMIVIRLNDSFDLRVQSIDASLSRSEFALKTQEETYVKELLSKKAHEIRDKVLEDVESSLDEHLLGYSPWDDR